MLQIIGFIIIAFVFGLCLYGGAYFMGDLKNTKLSISPKSTESNENIVIEPSFQNNFLSSDENKEAIETAESELVNSLETVHNELKSKKTFDSDKSPEINQSFKESKDSLKQEEIE